MTKYPIGIVASLERSAIYESGILTSMRLDADFAEVLEEPDCWEDLADVWAYDKLACVIVSMIMPRFSNQRL